MDSETLLLAMIEVIQQTQDDPEAMHLALQDLAEQAEDEDTDEVEQESDTDAGTAG